MKPFQLLLVLTFCFVAGACQKAAPPAGSAPQRFEVRGIVRAIGFAEQQLTVEHEEIPSYMPAMTMPFAVKEMREVEPLRTGDAIGFQLVVTGTDSWITGVKKIAASEVHLPAAKSATAPPNIERLKEGDVLPDFVLTDDRARPISRETFAGKPLVLTFIFTRCPLPNYCP